MMPDLSKKAPADDGFDDSGDKENAPADPAKPSYLPGAGISQTSRGPSAARDVDIPKRLALDSAAAVRAGSSAAVGRKRHWVVRAGLATLPRPGTWIFRGTAAPSRIVRGGPIVRGGRAEASLEPMGPGSRSRRGAAT